MKKNIFAVNLPANVDLPFATIKFMREPVKSDVRSIDDLPTATLNFIDNNTAEIHPFYLQIERKQVSARDYDERCANELIRTRLLKTIDDFGQSNNAMTLTPHYSPMHYESDGQTLRVNAEEQFFNIPMLQARPIDRRHHYSRSIYELSFGGKVNSFALFLTNTLRMSVWSEESEHHIPQLNNDPNTIFGTAKLFGRPAKVRVECDYHYHSYDAGLSIRNWLSPEVLRAAIEDRLQDVIGETFGPLTDDVIKRLLSDIEFNLN